jgi:hypothetical protein
MAVAVVGFLAMVGLVSLVSRLDLRSDRYINRALS